MNDNGKWLLCWLALTAIGTTWLHLNSPGGELLPLLVGVAILAAVVTGAIAAVTGG